MHAEYSYIYSVHLGKYTGTQRLVCLGVQNRGRNQVKGKQVGSTSCKDLKLMVSILTLYQANTSQSYAKDSSLSVNSVLILKIKKY